MSLNLSPVIKPLRPVVWTEAISYCAVYMQGDVGLQASDRINVAWKEVELCRVLSTV